MDEILETVLPPWLRGLERDFAGEVVFAGLQGSRAWGEGGPASDVDLGLPS